MIGRTIGRRASARTIGPRVDRRRRMNQPANRLTSDDRRNRLAVRAHKVRQSKKCGQHRIELGVEIAKYVRELGQDEVEEEQQNRARGEQKERGIAQRVAYPPRQRFGALTLRRQRFEDGHQRARGFADAN